LLALFWIAPIIAALVGNINVDEIPHPYSVIFGFVVLDAVVPIFPSESLLTTGSNLAAQTGSDIVLWRLIVAGSLGAIVGDSLLYWLSRTVLRRSMSKQVEKAQQNEKVARSLEVMSGTAPLLIVFGRFVPGLRFIVGAHDGSHEVQLSTLPAVGFDRWHSAGQLYMHLLVRRCNGDPGQTVCFHRRLCHRHNRPAGTAVQAVEDALGRCRFRCVTTIPSVVTRMSG
jgi:membrane protein YqaA with SNARE-associated domain